MSQKNYNFKFNPPEPTSEQINKHKDFDALLAQFEAATPPQTTPLRVVSNNTNRWRRSLMYAAGLAAAAMLALAIFMNIGGSDIENQVAERMLNQPFVNPTMQKLEKEYKTFTLEGTQGGVFEYESGSKVAVPANAFVDENGALVTGEVELRYKEYLIPMKYDSTGNAYQLNSAGMIDVQAFQNGNPVQLKANKTLNIELVSYIDYHPKDQYNVYRLDAENRNWTYRGIDNIAPILTGDLKAKMDNYLQNSISEDGSLVGVTAQIAAVNQQQSQELATIENSIPKPKTPLKPQPSNPDNFVTNFEFDDLDKTDPRIAELSKKYGNLLWEVSKDQADNFNIATNENASWDDVQLEKVGDRDFKVTLISGVPNGKDLTLMVRPVLAGVDYQNALEDYNAKLEAYNQAIQSRENQLAAQREAVSKKYENQLADLNNQKIAFENQSASVRQRGFESIITERLAKQKVINRFQVNGLGIWNCAQPVLPSDVSVNAKFQSENSQPLEFLNAYLVNDEQNTVKHFLTTGNESIALNVENTSEHLMWAVDNEGMLNVIYPETFKNIGDETKSYTFKFKELEEIESEAELRKVLGFKN
jgi:hypothetical protein